MTQIKQIQLQHILVLLIADTNKKFYYYIFHQHFSITANLLNDGEYLTNDLLKNFYNISFFSGNNNAFLTR